MKNKKQLLWVSVLLAAVIALAGIYTAYRATAGKGDEGGKTITVQVIHSDGAEKDFTVKTDAEYLGQALIEENIASGTEGPYGLMIEVVDGEEAIWEKTKSYWALYIGQDYASTGADQTPLHDGDSFKLEYTLG